MTHLYTITIIWLRNMDRQNKSQIQKTQGNIQKNNEKLKKEPEVKKEFYSSDDIEKLLLIM